MRVYKLIFLQCATLLEKICKFNVPDWGVFVLKKLGHRIQCTIMVEN